MSIEEILSSQGFFIFTGKGVSMLPMIREGADTVEVRPVSGLLRRGDVVLYKVKDSYLLHRILRVEPDCCIIRGDNCYTKETVLPEQILGVMVSFYRGRRRISLRNPLYAAYVFMVLHFPSVVRKLA